MAKIDFEYEGNPITLEFHRDIVPRMENDGFTTDDLAKKVSAWPKIFYYSLMAHHPNMKRTKAEKMFESMTRKLDLIMKLAEMYEDTRASLVESGNVEWTQS